MRWRNSSEPLPPVPPAPPSSHRAIRQGPHAIRLGTVAHDRSARMQENPGTGLVANSAMDHQPFTRPCNATPQAPTKSLMLRQAPAKRSTRWNSGPLRQPSTRSTTRGRS
eukprot:10102320-Alexandrium_andersonii.AAC.1